MLDRGSDPGVCDKRDKLGVIDAAPNVFIRQEFAPAPSFESAGRIGSFPEFQWKIDTLEEALVIRIENNARGGGSNRVLHYIRLVVASGLRRLRQMLKSDSRLKDLLARIESEMTKDAI